MLLSREELDACAVPHPQVAEFYRRNPQPPTRHDPLVSRAGLRLFTDAALRRLGPPPPGLEEFCHDIQMRDGHMSSLKIFKPSNKQRGPLIVLLFGGGFIAGDKDQLTEAARISTQLFGATVVNISYRLGPEYKFPYAQHDAWDSLRWIADNATGSQLASDPQKGFIIGGVSAGAAIAAALSRKLQEDPVRHSLSGQWLAVPSVMHPEACPEKYRARYISLEQDSPYPGLSKAARMMIQDALQWDKTSALRYAVNSKTPLSGQPRTYFQVDGMDPLRDDGLIYDEMLKDVGVTTKLDLYPGCPHAHWASMRGLEVGKRALIDTIVGIGWLLGREVSRKEAAEALQL